MNNKKKIYKSVKLTIGVILLLLVWKLPAAANSVSNGGDCGVIGIADQPSDALITYNISGTTFYLATNIVQVEITSGTFVFNNAGGEIENSPLQITIPPQAFVENIFIFISTDPINKSYLVNPQDILAANSGLPGNYKIIPTAICEIALQDEQRNWIRNKALNKSTEIRISYPDNDNDKYVDGIMEKMKVENLRMYYLYENTRKWTEIPNSEANLSGKYISAQINHFSVFALIGKVIPKDLSKLSVYPVPYKPGSGTRYDNPAGIVFDNVPEYLEIKIFNIAGELVFSEIESSTGGRYIWKAENNSGKKVASGIYIFILHDQSGNKKFGKLAIVR